MRIFGADIDVALRRANRERGNGHTLDQEERVTLHQHSIGEGAAVALVGVADDVFLLGVDPGRRPPFDAGRKAGAAAPAQTRGQNLLNRRLGTEAQHALEASKAAMTPVIVDRQGIGEAAAGKDKPLLARQIGDVVDAPERLGMRAAGQEARIEQRRDLIRRNRSVADAPGGGFDLDQRLEPKEAARTGAHNR